MRRSYGILGWELPKNNFPILAELFKLISQQDISYSSIVDNGIYTGLLRSNLESTSRIYPCPNNLRIQPGIKKAFGNISITPCID